MLFNQLGLRAELIEAVKANGYIDPTLIQVMAIPVILMEEIFLPAPRQARGRLMRSPSLWLNC
jgi:superfamily II DNA/RNA helicase